MRLPIIAAVQLQAMLASQAGTDGTSSTSLTIRGPSTIQSCTPATFSWTPTVAPYTLSIIDHTSSSSSASSSSKSANSDAQRVLSAQSTEKSDIDEQNLVIISSGESATWIVDYQPGQMISIAIVDGEGNRAETELGLVLDGGMECLN